MSNNVNNVSGHKTVSKFNLIKVPTVGGWAQIRRQRILNKNKYFNNLKRKHILENKFVNINLVQQRKDELELVRSYGVTNLILFYEQNKLDLNLRKRPSTGPLKNFYVPVRKFPCLTGKYSDICKFNCVPSPEAHVTRVNNNNFKFNDNVLYSIKYLFNKQPKFKYSGYADHPLWDIRKLFRREPNQKQNFIKFNSGFALGKLNGKTVFGPITRAEFYRRSSLITNKIRNNLFNKILFEKVSKRDKINFIIYNCKPIIKSIPNINCKNTSVKSVKVRSQIPDSAPRRAGTCYVPFVRSSSPILLYKLRCKILELKNSRIINKCKNIFKTVFNIKDMSNRAVSTAYCAHCYFNRREYDCICMNRVNNMLDELCFKFQSEHFVDSEEICKEVQQDLTHNKGAEIRQAICKHVQPEMDKDGEGGLNVTRTQDTTFADQRQEDVEQGPIFTERSWNMLTTTESTKSDIEMSGRDILLANFNWKTSDTLHKNIFNCLAPRDVVSNLKNSPIALLFKQHKFWNGKMVFTLKVNSNRVMTGALMMSWLYGSEQDKNSAFGDDNVYTQSQRLHGVCQAGSSNPVTIEVPFAFPYPFLCTSARSASDLLLMSLGKLSVNVLTPLRATSSSDTKASCALFVRFEEGQFTGMIDTSLALPQMDPWTAALALNATERVLNSFMPDQNRDNPPAITQPNPIQIQQGGNFSYGTGIVEPLNSLRLDARGQTPHTGLPKSEMKITDVTRVFGLITQLRWSNQYATGKGLGVIPASPVLPINMYPSRTLTVPDGSTIPSDVIETFRIIPPVAVISNLFKQFRGKQELKFECISNFFYSGSLLVAYIPGVTTPVSLDVAKSSSYVVFDLKEEKTFTYEVPYIFDKPWCNNRYSSKKDVEYEAPGSVQIFVINPLALNDSVPDEITINVYQRAGEDFELSVPVQPRISMCRHWYVAGGDGKTTKAVDGYFPYYVGTSRYFENDKYALLRYGSVNDHITYFMNLKLPKDGIYYKYSGTDAPFLRKKRSDGTWEVSTDKAEFAVAIKDPGNDYYWLAMCRSEADCISLCTAAKNGLPYEKYFVEYPNDDADNYYGKDNPAWTEQKAARIDFEIVNAVPEGARHEAPNKLSSTGSVPSSGWGLLHFGEKFDSLTTLLRRPQFIESFTIAKDSSTCIPVRFDGVPPIRNSSNLQAYYGREGYQGIISSGYRFVRGSYRMHLVETTGAKGLALVQHIPELHYDNTKSNSKRYFGQGYASFFQQLDVNPIITVEVPFYLNSLYGFLGTPVLTEAFAQFHDISSLGYVKVNYFGNSIAKFEVYSSLGDDARYEIFQGFPPLKFVRNIVNPEGPEEKEGPLFKVQPQGPQDEIHVFGCNSPFCEGECKYEPEPEGGVFSTVKKGKEVLEDVQETNEKAKEFLEKANSSFDSLFETTKSVKKYFSKDKMLGILSQFAHMIVSPHKGTIVVGIVSILLHLFSFDMSYFSKFQDIISKFVLSDTQEQAEYVKAEMACGEEKEYELIALIASIVGSMGAMTFGLSSTKANSLRKMFNDVNCVSRGINGFINLIGIIVRCTIKIIKYYLLRQNKVPDVHLLLKDQGSAIHTWASKVEELLDPTKIVEHEVKPHYPETVFDYYLQGTLFLSQIATCGGHNNAYQYIKSLVDRLQKQRNDLHQRGIHPFTRLTPYSLWICGKPGIGKSTMVTDLMAAMLKKIKVTPQGNFFYKIEIGNDHWDNVRPEHLIHVIDDAFVLKSEQYLSRFFSIYYNLITNAPFTPPMAAIDFKNMLIAPLALISMSNFDYPDSTVMADPEAFYRRRHHMWLAEVKPKYSPEKAPELWASGNLDFTQIPEDVVKEYGWLQFRKYMNPRDKTMAHELCLPINYTEFIQTVCNDFAAHYAREVKSFQERVELIQSMAIQPDDEEILDTTAPKLKKNLYEKLKKKWQEEIDVIESWFIKNQKILNKSRIQKIKNFLPRVPCFTAMPEMSDSDSDEEYDIGLLYELADQLNTYCLRTQNTYANNKDIISQNLAKCFKDFDVSKLKFTNPIDQITGSETFLNTVNDIIHNEDKYDPAVVQHYLDACLKIQKDILDKKHTCKPESRFSSLRCSCWVPVDYDNKLVFVPSCANCAEKLITVISIQESMNCFGCLSEISQFHPNHERSILLRGLLKFINFFLRRRFCLVVRKAIQVAKTVYNSTLGRLFKLLWAYSEYICPMLCVIGGMFVAYQYTKQVNQLIDKLPNPQGNVYAGATNQRGTGKLVNKELVIKTISHPEGPLSKCISVNHQASDTIALIERNTFHIGCEYTTATGQLKNLMTRILFIRSRQALIVRHCWDEIKTKALQGGKIILFKLPTLNLTIPLDKIKVYEYKQSNFNVLEFSAQVPEQKKITQHILTQEGHKRVTNNGMMVCVDETTMLKDLHLTFVSEAIVVQGTENSVDVPMLGCYKYNFGGPGYCGSVIICLNSNPHIVGMHVAGLNGKSGYCEPLLREMFEDVPVRDDDIVDIVLPKLDSLDYARMEIDGNFVQLGVVAPELAHHETGKTKIVPSLCHGLFPVETEPAPLHRFDPRLPEKVDPMFSGVEKLGQPIVGFPQELLDFGEECLDTMLQTFVEPVIGVAPVSLQEAVCGRPNVQGFTSLNFQTSEGFPLSSMRPTGVSNKKWLFDLEMEDTYRLKGINKTLKDIMSIKDYQRRNRIKPFTVFVDCLKDARIPKEKCAIPGKTRVFSISPVDFSIQFRQYFLPYLLAHQNSRHQSYTAVGINVLGPEWTDLCINMRSFSPYQACGDYSNFGAGFCAEVHERVTRCILKWFKFNGATKEENNVREVMFKELVNSVHLCYNVVYVTSCGMPSGSPITVETNDNVNFMYVAMAWRELMGDTIYNNVYHFLKFVKVKTYGDDLWLSIHPLVIHLFNNDTLSKFFAKYGVKYTDADKSGTIVPYKSFDEVSFLKRQPILHPTRPHMFLAKLDFRSVLDIANWCWESNDLIAATLVNLEACSDSLYGYGPEVHEKYRKILIEQARQFGVVGQFRTWYDLDRIYLTEPGDLVSLNLSALGPVTRKA